MRAACIAHHDPGGVIRLREGATRRRALARDAGHGRRPFVPVERLRAAGERVEDGRGALGVEVAVASLTLAPMQGRGSTAARRSTKSAALSDASSPKIPAIGASWRRPSSAPASGSTTPTWPCPRSSRQGAGVVAVVAYEERHSVAFLRRDRVPSHIPPLDAGCRSRRGSSPSSPASRLPARPGAASYPPTARRPAPRPPSPGRDGRRQARHGHATAASHAAQKTSWTASWPTKAEVTEATSVACGETESRQAGLAEHRR